MVFSDNILENRIKSDHTWWETKQIPFYTELNKGDISATPFYRLIQQSALHRAVVLMGPRRIGKTVMMYQAIQDLLDSGIEPKKILYFSLDTPFSRMFLWTN